MQQAPPVGGTRDRLLAAAAAVFAGKGFRRATVREIVAAAGVNLNAVNYHFRDKQGLYHAVLEAGHKSVQDDDDLAVARDPTADPQARLHAFVLALLTRALSGGHRPHQARIMMLEMAEPTGALDMVVERYIRPRFELLVEIIAGILPDPPDRQTLELCAESVVGQCVHLVHARPILVRILPFLTYSRADIERLAAHVTRFCLSALRNISGNGGGAA